MRKILLAFDGIHFPEGAFRFIHHIHKSQTIQLAGVYLPALSRYSTIDIRQQAEHSTIETGTFSEYKLAVERTIKRFKELCTADEIDFHILEDSKYDEFVNLSHESDIADLLLISSESFYNQYSGRHINPFLYRVLMGMNCPIMLVPDDFSFPEQFMLLYNGDVSSYKSIEQFSNLFPELLDRCTILADTQDRDAGATHLSELEKLAALKFRSLSLYKLAMNVKEYFGSWVDSRKRALVITGSYGKSDLIIQSEVSLVHKLIEDHRFAVFLAHE